MACDVAEVSTWCKLGVAKRRLNMATNPLSHSCNSGLPPARHAWRSAWSEWKILRWRFVCSRAILLADFFDFPDCPWSVVSAASDAKIVAADSDIVDLGWVGGDACDLFPDYY